MSFLSGNLGTPSEKLLVGPGAGLDAAVIQVDRSRVMAIAEDPVFPAPGLPLDIMGYFTVHIGASDVAVTGIPPRYMTYTLLLSAETPESDARLIIESISETASSIGVTICGGHTGWYGAVNLPLVGGVTVWGVAPAGRWISPGGARSGDLVLMTKGPAIEASALLGVLYREKLKGLVGPGHIESACARTSEITVVEDALTAYNSCAGVHAMHDATEGGVLGGLWEMQSSSGIPVKADVDCVEVPEDIKAVAAALNFDPWTAISEGTLLAAVAPEDAGTVMGALGSKGIPSHIIGEFDSSAPAGTVKKGGVVLEMTEPGPDPFWDLFFAGIS